MSTFTQSDFSGGMDLLSNDTSIADDSYRYLINGRTRLGSIKPIQAPLLINSPLGKKQGLVAVGNILVLFVSGNAYYQQQASNIWIKIGNFAMDAAVDYIYTCAVPSSTLNNKRQLTTNNIYGGITLQQQFTVSGTPQGLICQDGINQPWVIFYDAATNTARARVTHNYIQWNNDPNAGSDLREYVPIGTLMYYWSNAGILIILASDGITLYRSVSGRAMDFMIQVDTNGNKAATEDLGGADTTSISCGSQQVNLIDLLDSSHLMVTTNLTTYAVSIDSTLPTIYGEPQFDTPVYANIGGVNQFSSADNLGDKVIIDFEGIKSTNGVLNFKFVGRNDPFSLMISKLILDPISTKPIRQDICAVINFDNYIIASLKTRMGYALVVYDNLKAAENASTAGLVIGVPPARGCWVSIDITEAIQIKQFAVTNDDEQSYLFAITAEDKVFQLFGSTLSAVAQLRTKAYVNGDCSMKHKTTAVRAIYELGQTKGKVLVKELVDEMRGKISTYPISGNVCGVKPPIYPPVIPDTNKLVQNITFGSMRDGDEGYKLSYLINWDTQASLTFLQIDTSGIPTHISKEQVTDTFQTLLTTTS